jgi:hypothetical protein
MGAIYQALIPPKTYQLIKEEIAKPHSAPTPQSNRSFKGKTLKFGFKICNHSRCITLTEHLWGYAVIYNGQKYTLKAT